MLLAPDCFRAEEVIGIRSPISSSDNDADHEQAERMPELEQIYTVDSKSFDMLSAMLRQFGKILIDIEERLELRFLSMKERKVSVNRKCSCAVLHFVALSELLSLLEEATVPVHVVLACFVVFQR